MVIKPSIQGGPMRILFLISLFISYELMASELVQTGPWLRSRRSDYRYVTTYKIHKIKRPLTSFPWIEEDCHDVGNRFANWSKSMAYEIVYSGNVSFNLLGFLDLEFGKEKAKTIEFTFQRWVTPTLGLNARHILHEEFEIWEGETLKEYQSGSDLITKNKPTSFRLEKMNYGISVVREVLEVCPE